jgi:enoyl-CoA hydratase/carnithine racemase
MPELVHLEVDDGVGIVRLDRPPANAISLQLSIDLLSALEEAGSRDDVGALVLWGGPKLFAAGADIKEMVDHGPDEIREQVTKLGDACELLEATPKVSIAAITGFALGGGFELALACDLRYASSTAKLGQPEVNLGIFPGWGGTQRLARVCGLGVAKDMILTGRAVDADEALRIGLVNGVFESGELLEKTLEVAHTIASKGPLAVAAAKVAVNHALQGDHAENLEAEAESFGELFSSHDAKEGMTAFVEKRAPNFTGR